MSVASQVWELRVTLFLVLLLMVSSAFAEVSVIDKGGVFEHLKFWNFGLPFDQALQCGSSESFSSTVSNCTYQCNNQYCVSKCSEARTLPKFKLFVEDCADSIAYVYGENGFEAKVSREDYEIAGNTWLIGFLKAHSHFIQPEGRVELNWASPRQVSLIKGGKKQSVQATLVVGTIYSGETTQGFGIEVLLLPKLIGAAQIGIFRADREDVFMKLRGVLDESLSSQSFFNH